MRILLSVTAALIILAVRAQEQSYFNIPVMRPDLDSIAEVIEDRTSPFYYPRLMEEYERNDTTMKLDKYRYLYLGAMFREDYDPYRPSHLSDPDPIDLVASKSMLTRAECDTIISYCNAALLDDPFDLVRMHELIGALRARGRNALADIWQYKLRMIIWAILSTGTGLDEENAWYIIQPRHEYVLLNSLGLKVKKHTLDTREEGVEYVTVTDFDGHDLGGFYFNMALPLEEFWRKNPGSRYVDNPQ